MFSFFQEPVEASVDLAVEGVVVCLGRTLLALRSVAPEPGHAVEHPKPEVEC